MFIFCLMTAVLSVGLVFGAMAMALKFCYPRESVLDVLSLVEAKMLGYALVVGLIFCLLFFAGSAYAGQGEFEKPKKFSEGVDNPDKSCTFWNYEDGSGIKVESTDLRFDGDGVIQTNTITLGTDGKLTNHQILRFVGGATSDMVGAGKKFGDDTFISKCRIFAMNLPREIRELFRGLYGIPDDSDQPQKKSFGGEPCLGMTPAQCVILWAESRS